MLKYQTGLINQEKARLKDKNWYNQRFDGCLNFIWMISEAEIMAETRKMSGGNFTSHFCIFENHRVDWYIDIADMQRVTKIFLSKAKRINHLGKKLIKEWSANNKSFFSFLLRLSKTDLSAISDKQLANIYKNFSDIYLKTITSSSLIDGFALGSDEIIQTEINKLLDQRQIVKSRGEFFSTLTAPIHQSFINQAEISLLKIAGKIKTLTALKTAFNRPAIKRLVARHQQQYFWTKNNYHDNYVLSEQNFLQELKSILKSQLNIAEEIKKIQTAPRRNKLKKQDLIKRLQPSSYLVNLLEISEDFTFWQDERKKRTFLYTHYASLLLNEIGRRFGYNLGQMKYLIRAEVIDLMGGRSFTPSELAERSKLMFIYQRGNHYEIFSAAAAQAIIDYLLKNKDHSNIQDFRGLTACTGKARGIVRIVKSVKEVDKVKPGDILVAVMTRPDYIAGLKKAAAIVTDEGGITCHAAIISRELGIPCIIGTKIGTKVLKDGDLVEVNANHGWVRKVK